MLDFNRTVHKGKAANVAINDALDASLLDRVNREPAREYLGASSIGDECLRKIHWQWRRPKPIAKASTARVFWRGHTFEKYVADQFVYAGFHLQRGGPGTGFEEAGGLFRGHCDGIFRSGPEIDGMGYPCLWEMKALGEKSFRQIERDGLRKVRPTYYAQCQLYMAYLGVADHPAVFTCLNVENGELLHILVPFNAEEPQAASDRAVTVLRADAAGETLPRVADKADDFRCKWCSYREECWSA